MADSPPRTNDLIRTIRTMALSLLFAVGGSGAVCAGTVSDSLSAAALQVRGDTALAQGALDSAAYFLGAAADSFIAAEYFDNGIEARMGQAVCLYYLAELDSARSLLESSKPLSTKAEQPADALAGILGMLGVIYDALGDYERALTTALEALSLEEQADSIAEADLANSLNNVGAIYFSKTDYQKAVSYYERSISMFQAAEIEDEAAVSMINLGLAHVRLANYDAAIRILEGARKTLETLGDSLHLPSLYNNLGLAYTERGDYGDARRVLLEAEARTHEAGGSPYVVTLANLGFSCLNAGDYDCAQARLGQVVQMADTLPNVSAMQQAKMLLHYGQSLLGTAQHADAQLAFDAGIRLLLDLPPSARLTGSLQLEAAGEKRTLMQLLSERAYALQQLDAPEAAFQAYSQAFLVADQLRKDYLAVGSKQHLAAFVLPIYEAGIGLAAQLYSETASPRYLEAAFGIVERNKSILLLEAMQDAVAKTGAGLPDSLVLQEQALQIDIAFYRREIYQATQAGDSARVALYKDYLFTRERKRDALARTLERDFPAYYALKYTQAGVQLKDLKAYAANPAQAVVEYFVGDTSAYALVVSGDRAELIALERHRDWTAPITSLRRALSDWQYIFGQPQEAMADYTTHARGLYNAFLGPVFGDSLPVELTVIPDGLLAFIPFEALLTATPSAGSSYLAMPYVIRQSEVAYAYSAALLLQQAERERAAQKAGCLAFAPSYDGEQALEGEFARVRSGEAALPGAQTEVRAVSEHFSGSFLIGDAASEGAFKAQAGDYEILHLAMHGILDDEQSAFSYLAFAEGDAAEDGKLYSYEVEQMQLNADLVVLSACESGTGKLVRGEGVMSLARGFLHAGAGGVLMSLWQLEDATSAQVMTAFYEELATGLEGSAALRSAKLKYLAEADDLKAHPGFWAGYVLIGEPGAMVAGAGLAWYWMAGGGALLLLTGVIIFLRIRRSAA